MPTSDTPAHPSTSAALPGQLEELANEIYVAHGIQHFQATEPCCNKENVRLDTEMLMCVYKETLFSERSHNSTWGARLRKTGGRLASVQFPDKVCCPKE